MTWRKRPLGLFIVPWTTVAIVLSFGCLFLMLGLDKADQLGGALGFLAAIAGLAFTCQLELQKRHAVTSGVELSELTSRSLRSLAAAQLEQWTEEEVARNVLDPWPLPVRWTVTVRANAVAVSWPAIRGAPGAGPISLNGTYAEVADVYMQSEFPGRLVVLGEPGSGKTMLAMRLTIDLLRRRSSEDAVPILLPVATWNPYQPVDEWITARLEEQYQTLRQRVAAPDGTLRSLARELVATDRILPVLDGFDEMAEVHRAGALVAIADSLSPARRFVLTSRTAEYELAVSEGKLARTAVVEILPLRRSDVEGYLHDGTEIPARWEPVVAHLKADGDSAIGNTLSSPLMLSLARAVYHSAETDPTELVSDGYGYQPNRAHIEELLLSRLVPTLYRSSVGRQRAYAVDDVKKRQGWLVRLAGSLDAQSSYDIAWWRLRRTTLKLQWTLTAGLAAAGIYLSSLHPNGEYLPATLFFMFVTLPFFLLTMGKRVPRQMFFSMNGWRAAAITALSLLGTGVAIGAVRKGSSQALPLALSVGLFVFAVLAVGATLAGRRPALTAWRSVDASRAISPMETLRQDRRFTLSFAGTIALIISSVLGVYSLFQLTPDLGLATAAMWTVPITAIIGGVIALSIAFGVTAWCQFCAVRVLLAIRGITPLRLMSFLQDAHQRGILRQNGGVYQFRHARLQDHLATLDNSRLRDLFAATVDRFPGSVWRRIRRPQCR